LSNKRGDFIWYELMTNNADAAQEFYSAVLGWSFSSAGQGDKDYRVFSIKGVNVGGVLPLTPGMIEGGARPCWLGYIGVADVDRMVQALASAQGGVHMQPLGIPEATFQ